MKMKQTKNSIKRVARGKRYLEEHDELRRGPLNKAFQCPAFKGLCDTMFGVKRWSMEHQKYSFHGWGCDVVREPDRVWVRLSSVEAVKDLMSVMGAEVCDNSFSKYVNAVRLEDEGRTILALG